MDRLLVLVRHGQSEWNLKNLFTGWKDVPLTDQGIAEARKAGDLLAARDFTFDLYQQADTRPEYAEIDS